jgi:hypothetical protein
MIKPQFRRPEEMSSETRAPVSARVKASTKDILEKAAKRTGLSLGELIGNVLDDYVEWLNSQKQK